VERWIGLTNCIVLYLYVYIALLAVHTNQKCFQCERLRKKREVLREQEEALGSLVNNEENESTINRGLLLIQPMVNRKHCSLTLHSRPWTSKTTTFGLFVPLTKKLFCPFLLRKQLTCPKFLKTVTKSEPDNQ